MLKKSLQLMAIVIVVLLSATINIKGQNIAITDDETYSANAAAMLDVKSTSKGMLIPRVALVNTTDPISVTKPDGLLVWNTYEATYSVGYYFWNGSDWSPVGSSAGSGLTLDGANLKWGGSLTENTSITTEGNSLDFDVNGAGAYSINLSSSGDFIIYDNSSAYSCFTFQDDGDVGIGTISPLHSLHIRDYSSNIAGTDGVFIDVQNRYNYLNEQSGIRFANSSGTSNIYFRAGLFYQRTNSPANYDGDLFLANTTGTAVTASDAAIVVKPNQTVGIGTSSPGATLDVTGDLILGKGVAVNEFSTDGLLKGESDLAVPTEKAVKTYVDNAAGAGHTGSGTINYIPRWTSSTALGNSVMYQNSNKVGIGTTSPSSKLVVFGNNGLTDDDPIFEVKNDDGQTVFAVYPKGVRIWVDSASVTGKATGSRGGFAVGNLSAGKAEEEFFRVTRDSVRINVNESTKSKATGSRGGFAVGNLSAGKAVGNSLMQIRPENYFIGHEAGVNTTGSGNIFTGYYAGNHNTSGYYNVFSGYYSGYLNDVGDYNVMMGNWAGYYNTEGSYNVFLGNLAGAYNTLGSSNVSIGYKAGYRNTEGENNVNVGKYTGYYNTTGSDNIYIGNYTAYGASSTTGGDNNTFLGVRAGYKVTTAAHNCLMGFNAGYEITEGISNVVIGDSAGYLLSTGDRNTFVGTGAGVANSDKNDNTYIGNWAGIGINGSYNTFVGSRCGGAINAGGTPGTGSYNVGLGRGAMYDLSSGNYNTVMGYYAGNDLSDGTNNTFIGYRAGGGYRGGVFPNVIFHTGNNGTGNVFIGSYAGAGNSFNSLSNKLVIHNTAETSTSDVLIYGDFDSQYLNVNGKLTVTPGDAQTTGLYSLASSKAIDARNTDAAAGTNYSVYAFTSGASSSTNYGTYSLAYNSTYRNYAGYFYAYGSSASNNYGIYAYAGGASTNYAGYFSGSIYVSGSVLKSSDVRLKKNINTITGALGKLSQIRGVYYEWDKEAIKGFKDNIKHDDDENSPAIEESFADGVQIGVIAQEVEAVMPEAVGEIDDGTKAVDYTKLVPLLIQAINEQQQQLDAQNKEIEELKAALLKSSGGE